MSLREKEKWMWFFFEAWIREILRPHPWGEIPGDQVALEGCSNPASSPKSRFFLRQSVETPACISAGEPESLLTQNGNGIFVLEDGNLEQHPSGMRFEERVA
jgi:hypothetical protein